MYRLLLRLVLVTAIISVLIACGGATKNDSDGAGDAGVPDKPDQDGDGIADVDEGRSSGDDTDQDGEPDYLDDDSDGDGIPDYREAGDDLSGTPPIDSDGDGTPDFRDLDSDNNGLADEVDGTEDLDGDGVGNFQDLDDDGDNIPDAFEIGGGTPVDTDSDGTPDYQDTDSDNDTISDLHEGVTDPDSDNLPAYVDPDADGDCVSDLREAGDSVLATAPVDTDGDQQRDFLDLDSDNDGLLDSLEDDNCNGVVDPGESARTNGDTDGDGASDLIEEAAGTDPSDGTDNPQANGDFVFIVPYQDVPSPADDTLDFATDITQADVAFAVDNTGSMNDEIGNIKTSLTSLISSIRGQIPNTGFAVTSYHDFPSNNHGSAGEQPFTLHRRVTTTNTVAGLNSVQASVNTYVGTGGGDVPESGWEALYQIATGSGTSQGAASVPAFAAAPALAGEQTGTIGGVGFRTGSLPIAVWVTDACNHNTPGDLYGFAAATQASTIAALGAISARVIAVVSDPEVCAGAALTEARSAVNATNSSVPPSAWDGARPAGCGAGQCCTGIAGAGQAPSAGMCPLVFRVDGRTGAGLGDSVATAVKVLATFAEFDIGGLAQDDPSDTVDAVASFVDKVEANATAAAPCASGIAVVDTTGDLVNDTFPQVNPGLTVCFDVVPKMNIRGFGSKDCMGESIKDSICLIRLPSAGTAALIKALTFLKLSNSLSKTIGSFPAIANVKSDLMMLGCGIYGRFANISDCL